MATARWMEECEGWGEAKNRVKTRSRSTANKVFVALPGEYKAGKSVLNWALKNSAENSEIVITHVHVKTSPVNLSGLTNAYHSMYASINLERKRTDRQLDNYIGACAKLKFRAEKLVFEADDVAKGLLDLITLHGITALVMGDAQNKYYTTNVERPKSKKAIEVMQKADPSCKIHIVCRDDLICTREATSSASPVDAPSLGRSKLLSYLSQQFKSLPSVKQCSGSTKLRAIVPEGPEDISLDPFKEMPTRTQIRHELEMHSDSDSSSSTDLNIEAEYSLYETNKNHSTSSLKKSVLRNGGMRSDDRDDDDHTYARLQEALRVAKTLKKEVLDEQNKHQRTERELWVALLKTKQSDDLHQKELKEREEIEEKLANLDHYAKDLDEKLAGTQSLLHSIQEDHDRLLKEHEIAVKEVEDLRNKINKKNFSGSCLGPGPNTEFSYAELKKATQDFNDMLKTREDEFGLAYVGTISNAFVSVKLLHSRSDFDRLQFKKEVTVLSTLRHPNLVTLIGSCQDTPALVYEHVPRSLQEHLLSMHGGVPLAWQIRTRIIGEICSALIFLHSSKPNAIIHGNLRPETVLIDSDFHIKLSDYGTSTFLKSMESLKNSYSDPDIMVSHKPTAKSDVYSFGMIILHLLTGRSPLAITGVVEEALAKGELGSVIDASAKDWPVVQAMQLAYLGLRCAESLSKGKQLDIVNDVWRVLEPIKNAASLSVSPPFGPYLDGNGVPFYFVCPIFQEVMKDPQIAADGYTYEAEAIKGWLDSGHDRSPMTNLKLSHRQLITNYPLRSAIQEWFQHQL